MGGGEVARYIATYGSDRVAKAVFAAAVPPFLSKTADNPQGPLDDAAVRGFLDSITADRLAFLDGFATNFFSADSDVKVSEQQRQRVSLRGAEREEVATSMAPRTSQGL